MIIVKLSGGLGNQLFQYSFGRYLSLKHNTELKLDLKLNSKASDFTTRSLGLSKYNCDFTLVESNEIKRHKFFETGNLSRIERKINQVFPFFNKRYVVEKPFDILNKNLLINDCYYDGYWQSEYYFKSIRNIIINDLQFNFNLNESNKLLVVGISNSMSVSLHIRRSDYLSVSSNAKIFSICTLKYYQDAMNYFNLKFEKPIFYIFSDDIAWVEENFVGENFVIVDVNQDDPHLDMYLMSQCKHNIIANSSFSWWGAWLNSNKSKMVVAPKKWYADNDVNNKAVYSLIPKNWLLI